MGAFTDKGIKAINRPGYHADRHPDFKGLYLQVTEGKSGFAKSWVFRYTSPLSGKRREKGLGQLAACPLSKARAEARKLWQQVKAGLDPIEEARLDSAAKKAGKHQSITFDDVAKACIAAKRQEWRNAKHASQWTNTLNTYASPLLGKLPIQQVDTAAVLSVLEPIWSTKTETATRVRQRIETVIDYAKAREQYQGENPARLQGHLAQLLPKAQKIKRVQHHPALPYADLPAFVVHLRAKGGLAALALEFLILTAARTGEVIGATWDEVDLERHIWTVPTERMKTGRSHRVALNTRAVEILKKLQETAASGFIFPGHKQSSDTGLSNGAMLALMKGMPEYARFTPHGFRSSFRDWAAEQTNYQHEVVEMALAHTIRNQVEAAYRRGDLLDKRALLMTDWGRYVNSKPDLEGTVN